MIKPKFFNENNAYDRLIGLIGHSFFVVYITFSLFYYIERTVAFDGAFYCFKILHNNSVNIENGRWGVSLIQWLPLIGLYMSCGLKTFLILYSLSYALWNYLFFIIIFKFYKNSKVALAYLLALVLFYRYSFFYPVSEIHSTIGPIFLTLSAAVSLIKSNHENNTKKVVMFGLLLILSVILTANIHIISMVPVGFFIIYLLIKEDVRFTYNKKIYLVFSAVILFYVIKLISIPHDSYEGSRIISFKSIKFVFTNLENIAGFDFFKHEIIFNYSIAILFVLVTLILMVIRKQFLKAGFVAISLFGFWLIIMAYNIEDNSPLNYQNYYCYFGVIAALPLAEDLLFTLKKRLTILCICLILIFSFYKIVKSGLKFTDRTAYITRSINNLKHYNERKFTVSELSFDSSILWGQWDLSFESLILSSIQNRDSALTFYTDINLNKFDYCASTDTNCFIGVDFSPLWFSVRDVNRRCFKLKKSLYRKVNTLQDSTFNDQDFTKKNLDIVLKDKYILLRSDSRQIEIEINNLAETTFNSLVTNSKSLQLSYHIYDTNGKLILENGKRTNFEMDIPPKSRIKNGLSIDLKTIVRGNYILETDVVHEGKRWFGINKRTKLTIY